jgi:hypothetical protein
LSSYFEIAEIKRYRIVAMKLNPNNAPKAPSENSNSTSSPTGKDNLSPGIITNSKKKSPVF